MLFYYDVGATTFSIATFSIMTLSDDSRLCRYDKCHCTEFLIIFIVMLNVNMLSVVMLSANMLSVIIMSVAIFYLDITGKGCLGHTLDYYEHL